MKTAATRNATANPARGNDRDHPDRRYRHQPDSRLRPRGETLLHAIPSTATESRYVPNRSVVSVRSISPLSLSYSTIPRSSIFSRCNWWRDVYTRFRSLYVTSWTEVSFSRAATEAASADRNRVAPVFVEIRDRVSTPTVDEFRTRRRPAVSVIAPPYHSIPSTRLRSPFDHRSSTRFGLPISPEIAPSLARAVIAPSTRIEAY